MKIVATIVFIWLIINLTALIINLAFSNLLTGSILFLSFFITGVWIIAKFVKEN